MTSQNIFDLDAYFRRIGYAGDRTATLETLRGIVVRHTEAIPFENINPLMGWPVRLDLPALEQKLVRDSRGGYCFEQNLLLSHALRALGFSVVCLSARVIWNAPEGALMPRTHMLLCVEFDAGPYLADVGFGGQSPTAPLRLEPHTEQATPHEPFRVVRTGEEFVMQTRIRGMWNSLYRFDLQEQHLIDYQVANWYVSTHPDSRFLNGLMAGRSRPGRRYALFNNELSVYHLDGDTERRVLTSAAELREILEGPFGLTLPAAPELDATLARLAAS